MKSIAERHNYIISQLAEKGFVTVQKLADELDVTPPTIRKDLRILESKHLLIRAHGSATTVKPRVLDRTIREKSIHRIEDKKMIAKEALKFLNPEDAIIIASGSTCAAFAKELTTLQDPINVVTPALGIAFALNDQPDINVMTLGGKVYKKSMSVRGDYAEAGLANVSCSKLFFGCDGIDTVTGITCTTVEEATLTNAMMKAASQIILMSDSSKFGRRGFGKICKIEDIDIIITDKGIPEAIKEQIEEAGVQVIIAGEDC